MSCADEVKSVACHPEQGLLVLSGGADDRGYLWRIWSDDPQDVHEFSGMVILSILYLQYFVGAFVGNQFKTYDSIILCI